DCDPRIVDTNRAPARMSGRGQADHGAWREIAIGSHANDRCKRTGRAQLAIELRVTKLAETGRVEASQIGANVELMLGTEPDGAAHLRSRIAGGKAGALHVELFA